MGGMEREGGGGVQGAHTGGGPIATPTALVEDGFTMPTISPSTFCRRRVEQTQSVK